MEKKRNYVIGIAGPSASGKTYIASYLKKLYPEDILVIGFDNYCKDFHSLTDDFASLNYDEPASYEGDWLAKDVHELKENRAINMPQYDFSTHSRREETVEVKPKNIIIVEGILSFVYPSLLEEFDLKVYVDAPVDLRYERRLKRDQKERGRSPESIKKQWDTFVYPMESLYVNKTKGDANILLVNDKNDNLFKVAAPLVEIIERIRQK